MELEERIESIYELYRQMLLEEKHPEKQLHQLKALIHFCWMNYPLRFADVQLDELLLAHALLDFQIGKKNDQHEVYIASTLMEVGGHTRCLMNLIEHQPNKSHTVLLTNQKKPLPENVLQVFKENRVQVVMLKTEQGLIDAAAELQDLIKSISPARVFLFHHADDVLPALALIRCRDIQTIYYNHSDHVFSVGVRYFSNSLEFRNIGAQISQQARGIKKTGLHPLPVARRIQSISKKEARKKLGLPEGGYIVGTLTNPSKAKPQSGRPSMIAWMIELALQHPNHVFLIVGLEHKHLITWASSGQKIPVNLHAVGIQSAPALYYFAMDFFLEPFPIGSGLGIIEAAHYGAIPVFTPHDAQLCSTFEVFDLEIQALFNHSESFDDTDRLLNQYLNQSEKTTSELSRNLEILIEQKHRGDQWIQGLEMALVNEVSMAQLDTEQIRREACFFQAYQQKTLHELLTYMLASSHLSTLNQLKKLFRHHRYLFTLKNLSRANIKRILLRLKLYPTKQL